MTFDREPDLDNANVGMPDTSILYWEEQQNFWSYRIGSSFFVEIFTEDKKNGKGKRNRA